MKLKFFITIFFVLVLTAFSISAIHFHFFNLERLRLMEINLEQNNTLILKSDITLSKKEFQKRGTEYVEDMIGNDKVNMIIAIYNQDGSLLYQNDNAVTFGTPTHLPENFEKWEDVETKEYYIKYLTSEDQAQQRIVRVGMVLNQSLLRWKYLNQRIIIFAAIILLIILLISYFLTSLLLKPIHILSQHVNDMASSLETGQTEDFNFLLKMSNNRFNDEFSTLITSIQVLSKKISESHNITKKWSAMMAHELKTPLTILKNRVESLSLEPGMNPSKFAIVDVEMLRLEKIIENFLEWASFENDPDRPEIHAVSIRKRAEYNIVNLREAYPEFRIDLKVMALEDDKIFCNPIHFDQVLSNLITNAIKYGKGEIRVECTADALRVSDEGAGIPEDVIRKLGAPFNHHRVNGERGFGLGLAWITTICRKYQWQMTVKNAQVSIVFNSHSK